MSLTIRRATLDDAELLARLSESVQNVHVVASPHLYKPYALNSQMVDFYRIRLNDPLWTSFIGELDRKPIGYAVMQIVRRPETPFTHAMNFVLVDQLSVEPAYQRLGYGQQLMEAVYQLAREHGLRDILLNVGMFNQQAIRFYEKQGFRFRDVRMEMTIPVED